eukprot:1709997-Rhodomonas_salina.2
MHPVYMSGKPTPEQLKLIRRAFMLRHCINDCHCEYCNYKNQYSVLCLMFVNSYYLFAGVDVGFPGRASDMQAVPASTVMKSIQEDPVG